MYPDFIFLSPSGSSFVLFIFNKKYNYSHHLMLIGPFRMYFVKKRVKWHLAAHSPAPSAGGRYTTQQRPQKISVYHRPRWEPFALSQLVLSAVSCSSSSQLSHVEWAPCACVCVFVRCICRLCRNPLNVSSSQSKSWGEPAWPAEFRWVLLVLLIHAALCVCCYQLNLSVCWMEVQMSGLQSK